MTRKLDAEEVKAAIEKKIKEITKEAEECHNRGAFEHENHLLSKRSGLFMALVAVGKAAAIDSLAAAEPDAGERAPRPPMLLAERQVDGYREWRGKHWWQRAGDRWVRFEQQDRWHRPIKREQDAVSNHTHFAESEWLINVDRTASDEAALKLYDADVAASGRTIVEPASDGE